MTHVLRLSLRGFSAVLALSLLAAALPAQQTGGEIRGKVTDGSSNEALVGANILVVGTTLGSSTDSEGNYSISVPPGTYTVHYRFIGYIRSERSVTVTVGQTTTVDVALLPDILEMDEVVVTGTGGLPATKARLGNSISTVSGSDLSKVPVQTITQAFEGRTTGVQILNSNGLAGMGSLIQLRGANSLTGDTQPLIIVDGVRFTQYDSYNNVGNGGWDGRGGPAVSTLNLLNPNDIDRVEILKGPSAAVLYGSDAANGVIQIFTKSGAGLSAGTRTYEYSTEYAYSDWSIFDTYLTRASKEVLDAAPLGTTSNRLSISGAGAQYRFYSSAAVRNAHTGFAYNSNENLDFKGNFTYNIDQNNRFKVLASYTRDLTQRPETDNSTWSPWFQSIFKHDSISAYQEWQNPYDGRTYVSLSEFSKFKNNYKNNRYSGGFEYSGKLPYNLNLEARVGYENLGLLQVTEINSGFRLYRAGYRIQTQQTVVAYNAQAILSGNFAIMEDLDVDVSYGLDYYRQKRDYLNANSSVFAPGADRRLEDGDPTSYFLEEINQLFTTGSMFSQAQIDFRKRLFLTLGARVDKSSSFGSEAPAQFYPKASASFLLPVEGIVPALSMAKVRASYGEAGRQPAIGAAELEFRKDDLSGAIQAFYVRRPGNPELKPALSREYEGGVDLAFFENRLGVEATYYHQETTNDIFTVDTKPSDGYGNRQQAYNLGKVRTRGFEFSIFGVPVSSPAVRWQSRLNLTTYDNRVLDDGGFAYNSTPFANLQILRIERGHSVPELYIQTQEFDQYGNMTVGPPAFRGKVIPTLTGNFITDLTLFESVSITVNFAGATGHKIFNLSKEARRLAGIFDDEFKQSDWDAFVAANAVPGPSRTPEQIAALIKFRKLANRFSDEFIEDGTYVKLREISVHYSLPKEWTGAIGFHNIMLSLAARNVLTFTKYEGMDPEVSVGGAGVLFRGADSQSIPSPRLITFGATFTL